MSQHGFPDPAPFTEEKAASQIPLKCCPWLGLVFRKYPCMASGICRGQLQFSSSVSHPNLQRLLEELWLVRRWMVRWITHSQEKSLPQPHYLAFTTLQALDCSPGPPAWTLLPNTITSPQDKLFHRKPTRSLVYGGWSKSSYCNVPGS